MLRPKLLPAALAALLCIPLGLTAAAAPAPAARGQSQSQPRYRVVDLGSLGGDLGILQGRSINRRGMAVGFMSTAESDPFCDFETWEGCFYSGNVDHAFLYSHGKTWDLGALAQGVSSSATGINEPGLVTGQSENGRIDPATGFPETRAVLWVNRKIRDLGTLGGSQSIATNANLLGQAVGGALTAKSDPFADAPMAGCRWSPISGSGSNWGTFAENTFFFPGTTATHATLWWGSAKFDLGTLGGPDSTALDINELGQVAGWSYTSYHANEFGVPDVRPFVWSVWDRKMRDLGTLGGACAMASAINNRGEVVGYSTLVDNSTLHPFLWTAKGGMRDLGTLGGPYAHANASNDRGEVIGYSTMLSAGQAPAYNKGRAFYWYKGVMKNLGTFGDAYSDANGINNRGQIVGETFTKDGDSLRGWISDRGGPIVDLNTLIDPNAGYEIIAGGYITDAGVIGARALAPNGDEHPVMLVPIR
ncbi:MAG: hypothetical protein EPN38_10595 [Rhodanobacteraceae bacterium]|nr:MAG: hypothetical protein EPN38_10595 [Rhodanobacteraceae bacterium]